MFLHLGSDYVVPLKNVIAITDMKNVKSGINQEFIKAKRSQKVVIDISEGNPKSFVITDKKIYLSAISALTLKKRADHVPESEEE
ncbi:MAG: DUF370 domain-containing protein [Sporomusaceae bacterium]|nr:DUF370 domain-containing protein [Sporomusaceae bacterium]